MEGSLKYSHSDSIQCLSLNRVTGVLLSCTSSDFGLWSKSNQKAVTKIKVLKINGQISSKIVSCSWTSDGQIFALGLYNGIVSIRGSDGQERYQIQIPLVNSPIWALEWSPMSKPDGENILAVTDWDKNLHFFELSGRQVGNTKTLNFDSCSISYYKNGQYIVIVGSDRRAYLFNSEGIKIGQFSQADGWIWSSSVNPAGDLIAIGAEDGTINVMKLAFNDVYSVYNDKFAYRHHMTDIVIQHMQSGQKSRIKCKDQILKISIYKDRLGVALTDKTIIYESLLDDTGDIHYRIKEKIPKNLSETFFHVTSMNIVTCSDKKIRLYNYYGEIEREWALDSVVKFIKVVGGPRGKEILLIGQEDGSILKIFIDSPFHVPVINVRKSILTMDMNLTRKKLAVIDDSNLMTVFDLKTQQACYQEPYAESVSWNMELDDALCFSGKGNQYVKISEFPPLQISANGKIICCRGSRIFSVEGTELKETYISLLPTMEKYMYQGKFEKAYEIASLGMADSEWKKLGIESLEHMSLKIATKCFVRIQEFRYLEGISHLESYGKKEADLFLAEVYALNGNYNEVCCFALILGCKIIHEKWKRAESHGYVYGIKYVG